MTNTMTEMNKTMNPLVLSGFKEGLAEEVIFLDDNMMINQINMLSVKKIDPSIKVSVFTNVPQALDYIRKNPDTPRIIFTDLDMGVHSGWDFIDAYEAMHLPWPVNIMTASIAQEDMGKSDQYSCVRDYISKPARIQQLQILLKQPLLAA
ncbi:MAG: response regulator [Chitinophagales bacterium]|nr:response regulator [Chitinophagales bacterium]